MKCRKKCDWGDAFTKFAGNSNLSAILIKLKNQSMNWVIEDLEWLKFGDIEYP